MRDLVWMFVEVPFFFSKVPEPEPGQKKAEARARVQDSKKVAFRQSEITSSLAGRNRQVTGGFDCTDAASCLNHI